MMSVPAINSLPASGNQPSKINTNSTANTTVSPIGLSVPPMLSVIPSPQIPTSPNKTPPVNVNHSSATLSLMYENKVVGSQPQPSLSITTLEIPKDISPLKPTSNGVELQTTKVVSPIQQLQPSSVPINKTEEGTTQLNVTNHVDERIHGTCELLALEEDTSQSTDFLEQNVITEKIEQNQSQIISNDDEKVELNLKQVLQELFDEENSLEENSDKIEMVEKSENKTPPSQSNEEKGDQEPVEKKNEETEPELEKKPRRVRSQVLPYQSPLPELATFINKSLKEKDATPKNNEEKLIVFYRNEFLAVRNAEGGFYLCQTLQNVYRSSHRIRIRWLSQEKEKSNEDGDIYTPDFYDLTDFECILTTVALSRQVKNMYKLRKVELERIENILKRALDVEKGVSEKPSITEEHPDGIDLSLYKNEKQLQKPKKGLKRTSRSPSRRSPKQLKKDDSGEVDKSLKKGKGKNRSKTKEVTKTTSKKSKIRKRSGGRSDSKSSKVVDQLKVSPPNEKARVVAKVLRKVDIVSAKEISTKKQVKSKVKRSSSKVKKTQKKKSGKTLKKGNTKDVGKEESSVLHNERRQIKNKHSSNKSN